MTRIGSITATTIAVLAIATALTTTTAFAQGPGGPPPPGGGQAGFGPPPPGGPGGGGGPGMFGRPHPMTALDISMDTLTPELTLTADQVTKIQAIKDLFDQDRDTLMPPPGDDAGAPPDPSTMRANRDQLHAKAQDAIKGINAVLTDTQTTALKSLLKTLRDLRAVGIPPSTYEDLKLTSAQKTKLIALAQSRRDKADAILAGASGPPTEQTRSSMRQLDMTTRQSARDVLTDDQKDTVDDYVADNPPPPGDMPGPPPGGRPGPPPNGFGDPPPGDASGPPPGDSAGPPPPGS